MGQSHDSVVTGWEGFETSVISIARSESVTGVRQWVVALPFVGAALVGFGTVYRWVRG